MSYFRYKYSVLLTSLALLVWIAYGIYGLRKGPLLSPDSMRYLGDAERLIEVKFNYVDYLEQTDFIVNPVFYVLWVTVVALSLLVFGPSNIGVGIVALNWTLSLPMVWMVLILVRKSGEEYSGLLLSVGLLLIAYEIFSWIPFVLSDISFMTLSLTVLYLLCLVSWTVRPARAMLGGLLLSVICLFFRPTALPIVALALSALLMWPTVKNVDIWLLVKRARLWGLGICLTIATAIFIHALVIQNPSRWPLEQFSSWIEMISQEYHAGYVIYDRPETYHIPSEALGDFVLLTLRKCAYFFAFSTENFSLKHKLGNWAFFLPAWGLAFFAIVALFTKRGYPSTRVWWMGWLCFWEIILFSVFHSLQEIDFDWRYRLPCLPPLIILAGLGLGRIRAMVAYSFRSDLRQQEIKNK